MLLRFGPPLRALGLLLGFATFGCGGSETGQATASGPAVAERLNPLARQVGSSIARVKSAAMQAAVIAPAAFGNVAAVVLEAQFGVSLDTPQSGQQGRRAVDIDGDGTEETVAVFVPSNDGKSGTGATKPAMAAWSGDATSNDAGLCYLAWTSGTTRLVFSRCGESDGAWVCSLAEGGTTCSACNLQGSCTTCDMSLPTLCDWP